MHEKWQRSTTVTIFLGSIKNFSLTNFKHHFLHLMYDINKVRWVFSGPYLKADWAGLCSKHASNPSMSSWAISLQHYTKIEMIYLAIAIFTIWLASGMCGMLFYLLLLLLLFDVVIAGATVAIVNIYGIYYSQWLERPVFNFWKQAPILNTPLLPQWVGQPQKPSAISS